RLLLVIDAADVCGGDGQHRLDVGAWRDNGSGEEHAVGSADKYAVGRVLDRAEYYGGVGVNVGCFRGTFSFLAGQPEPDKMVDTAWRNRTEGENSYECTNCGIASGFRRRGWPRVAGCRGQGRVRAT